LMKIKVWMPIIRKKVALLQKILISSHVKITIVMNWGREK
jgi:hypothetical protein